MENQPTHETKQYRAELTDLSIEHLEGYIKDLYQRVLENVTNNNSKRLLDFAVNANFSLLNMPDRELIFSEIKKDIEHPLGIELVDELIRCIELLNNKYNRG